MQYRDLYCFYFGTTYYFFKDFSMLYCAAINWSKASTITTHLFIFESQLKFHSENRPSLMLFLKDGNSNYQYVALLWFVIYSIYVTIVGKKSAHSVLDPHPENASPLAVIGLMVDTLTRSFLEEQLTWFRVRLRCMGPHLTRSKLRTTTFF